MKHLDKYKIFENKHTYIDGSQFRVVRSLLDTFEKRFNMIKETAEENNYELIKELADPKDEWAIYLVFQSTLEENEEIRGKQWQAMSSLCFEMLPTIDPVTKRRFTSHHALETWDIEEWEKSKKLSQLNGEVGIFERNNAFPMDKFLTIKVYLDWG
jgi:hypothetical protein